MKKIIYLILLISITGFSQIIEPVKWSTTFEKISDLEYNIVITATIDDTWHLYSQKVPEDGPLPTVFKFSPSSNLRLIGNTSEEKGLLVYEKVFDKKIKYFEKKAIFKQRIKLKNRNPFIIKGNIEYMSCNNEKCVPGYNDFEIKIR